LTTTTFSELQLVEPLQRALAAEGYTTPTPIQAAAIPHLLEGRDLLGCAQTGTGKTAAFALPILQQLDRARQKAVPGAPRVLVLAPTRELAAQISESFATYGRFVRFLQAVIYGGVGQGPQVRALDRGVHVVVATPGRLLDLMNQGHVRLNRLEVFVLDEADRMLDLGFLPDLRRIISKLPSDRHSLFFSATLPERVADLAHGLLTDPIRVEVTPPSSTVDRIEQRVLFVERNNKRALLRQVLGSDDVGRTLVFTRTKRGADRVAKELVSGGIQADAIHGDKSQSARGRVLHGFRSGMLRVLVATDLAARGIDVDGITHVINYDMPHEPESYVHRIGRTGRAGADGIALSFCDSTERSNLKAIERLIQSTIEVDSGHPFHSNLPQAKRPVTPRGGRNSRTPRKRTYRSSRKPSRV
jgi:ATP-dependent RNA helicase RhlE